MPKQNPKRRWAKWNNKLDRFDLTIDLADIGHISKRAYATGYLSRKVIKKWRSRGRKSIESGYCRAPKKCEWLPARVTKDVSSYKEKPSFWWRCRKCRCVTQWVFEDDLSEPMLNAYREHTRKRSDMDEDCMEVDQDRLDPDTNPEGDDL